MKWIKRNIGVFFSLAMVVGCGTTAKVETIYRVIEATVVKDSVVKVELPVERVVDIVPVYDTLKMETSLAASVAYVDTMTHTLKGAIENKDAPIEYRIQWKEKEVIRDSVVTQVVEKPVEVVRVRYPKSYWVLWAILIGGAVWILKKFLF